VGGRAINLMPAATHWRNAGVAGIRISMEEHATHSDSTGRWFMRPTAWAAAGYLAVLVLLFHRLLLGEVLSPAANLYFEVPFRSVLSEDLTRHLNGVEGDVWRQFEPWHRYQYQAAQAGRFPLWNPHVFCGMPFHANAQSAMLSPFHWLYFVIDPKWAAGPVAALKLAVAGFATFCLGRRLGMLPLGAFLAGLAWMLCAFHVRWLLWNHSSAAAWLPVVLLTLDRLGEQVTRQRLAVAGLAATALQLSGHPESQFHVGVLAGLYVLVRVGLQRGSMASRGRVLGAGLAAQVLGLLGASAALMPFAEQLTSSADWKSSMHALQRTLPADRLLGLVAPDHFGRPRGGRWYTGPLNYVEVGCYVGLVPLALAVAALLGLALQPRRTATGPAGAATIQFSIWLLWCGAIVLGVPGVFQSVHFLPLFSKADNLRLLLGLQFAAAMLAGAAWTQLLGDPTRLRAAVLRGSACGIALLVGWLLVSPHRVGTYNPDSPAVSRRATYNHREGLTQLWSDRTVTSPREHRSLRTLVSFGFALAGAAWAALAAAGFVVPGSPSPVPFRRRVVLVGGVCLTAADLVWVAYDYSPTLRAAAVFPDAPESLRRVAEWAGDGRIIATEEILAPNLAIVYGLRDARGYDYPIDERLAELFGRLDWQVGFTFLPRGRVIPEVQPNVQSVCDKLSVRFLYTDVVHLDLPVRSAGAGGATRSWPLVLRGAARAKDAVYQNPTAYPRAYFARQVRVAGADAALHALLDVTHDLRAQSVVEPPAPDCRQLAPLAGTPTVTIVRDDPEVVILHTRSDSTGLLVLSDRYEPNWRVTIDGQSATPLRTNYLFRGVVVPAGHHTVRWVYRPMSFYGGCVISIAAVAGLLIAARRDHSRAIHHAPTAA
jgi:hypothetical protein